MDQSTKAPEARKSDPETNLAQHRLSVLELPKETGNLGGLSAARPRPDKLLRVEAPVAVARP